MIVMVFPLLGQAVFPDLLVSMIGLAAAGLTTFSFLPLILLHMKVAYRTKSTKVA